jgi:hypothetical protein
MSVFDVDELRAKADLIRLLGAQAVASLIDEGADEIVRLRSEVAKLTPRICAYCGGVAEGEYSVSRDADMEGDDLDLCNKHGERLSPTLHEIWKRIAERTARGERFTVAT